MNEQKTETMNTAVWTAKQAQIATGFSEGMIYQLLNRKDTGAFSIGRRRFFNRDMFLAWIDEQARKGE